MSVDAPIAVAVSAYNRSSLLAGLVAALKAQTLAGFEAVIVDNGSTDDTSDVLRRCVGDDPRFTILRIEDNAGPAGARNLAWRSTTAPFVAFTDDDCRPRPRWLEQLLEASSSADVVQGRTMPAPTGDGEAPGWFDRTRQIESWSGRYETCNLGVRRPTLEAVDGFDEQFPIAMGEDTDLGLRAVREGARTSFAAGAVVHHHVWPGTFREYLDERRRYSEVVQLMGANPDARQLLIGGYVLRYSHLAMWALVPVTVGSVAAGRWWVTPAIVGAWAIKNGFRHRRPGFSIPRGIGNHGLKLAAYAYETACFARASARYRTLVI